MDPADPHSSFTLEIKLSIGYHRRRALVGTRVEGTVISVLLALGGVLVVGIFLFLIAHWTGVV